MTAAKKAAERWRDVATIPPEDVSELFAPHRPDADAFARGVAERIRTRAREADEENGVAAPSLWRRVAALMALDPLSGPFGGATTGTAVTGATAAKLFGGKTLSATLFLPALLLAAVIGGFLRSLHVLRAAQENREAPATRTKARDRRWLTITMNLSSMLVIVTMVSPWARIAVDVLTGMLVLSMLALTAGIRAGGDCLPLDRAGVAKLAQSHLAPVVSLCFVSLTMFDVFGATSEVGRTTAFVALVVALLLAGYAARGQRWNHWWWLWIAAMFALNAFGVVLEPRDLARRTLVAIELDARDLTGWENAAALAETLTAVGADVDVRRIEAEVRAALRAPDAGEIHPRIWTTALDLGLFTEEDWRALGEARRPPTYWGKVPVGPVVVTDYDRYALAVWLTTEERTSAEREWLAEGLLLAWPSEDVHAPLQRALVIVKQLELLGRHDLVAPLRDRALELVERHWVPAIRSDWLSVTGGFTSDRKKFRTSFDDASLDAIELMARFGVPSGIHLGELEAYLRRTAAPRFFLFEPWPYLHGESRAGLLRFREQLDLPERSGLQWLLDERFTLASLLLAALTFLAIRQAPRRERGAMP